MSAGLQKKKQNKTPLHLMFSTIESLEFLHWRDSQVGRGDEKHGRLVQSYVSSWHTVLFCFVFF